MKKNVENIKKEFDDKILEVGNKLSFAFLIVNFVLYCFDAFLRRMNMYTNQIHLYMVFIFSTAFILIIFILNAVYKWKLKIMKYICTIFPIVVVCIDLCVYSDSDSYLFLLSFLSVSVIFLDAVFMFIIGAITILDVLIVIIYRANTKVVDDITTFLWYYYYPLLTLFMLTIFFIFVCKSTRKIMLNEKLDEYEIEKSKKDNALASKIQEGFLNCDFPSNDVYDINACMIPSKDVGGDFYDFYMIDKSRLAMIVADVSGKGIPAALFMANAKTIIRDYVIYGVSFEKSIESANREIMYENKEMQFITLFICIVDLITGKMNYINAGHVKPFVIDKNGNVSIIISKPDFIFGVRKDTRYHSKEYTLSPGDKLFLCTDGVTERLDVNDKLYGKERLMDVLSKNCKKDASEIIPSVLDALKEYGKGREQNDDITCLLLNYKNKLVLDEAIIKDFDVAKDKIDDVATYIKNSLKSKNVPEKIISLMIVANDEIVSNINKYAYEDSCEEKKLNVHIEVYNRIISVVYTDYGKYFNPLSKITVSGTTKVTDKSKIGGLGIQLVWNIMDKVTYNRLDDKNMLLIEKEY